MFFVSDLIQKSLISYSGSPNTISDLIIQFLQECFTNQDRGLPPLMIKSLRFSWCKVVSWIARARVQLFFFL